MASGTIQQKYTTQVYSGFESNISRSGSNVDTMTLGASVTLPAGTYLIIAVWAFNTGTTSSTRNCSVEIGTSDSVLERTRVFMAGGNWAKLSCVSIETLEAETTIYSRGSASQSQSSGNLDTSRILAVRLA